MIEKSFGLPFLCLKSVQVDSYNPSLCKSFTPLDVQKDFSTRNIPQSGSNTAVRDLQGHLA